MKPDIVDVVDCECPWCKKKLDITIKAEKDKVREFLIAQKHDKVLSMEEALKE